MTPYELLEPAASRVEQGVRSEHRVSQTGDFVTGPWICQQLGISRWTWRRWVRSGLAPQPSSLPGFPKWRLSDIERFERGGRRFFSSHLGTNKSVSVHDRTSVGASGRRG